MKVADTTHTHDTIKTCHAASVGAENSTEKACALIKEHFQLHNISHVDVHGRDDTIQVTMKKEDVHWLLLPPKITARMAISHLLFSLYAHAILLPALFMRRFFNDASAHAREGKVKIRDLNKQRTQHQEQTIAAAFSELGMEVISVSKGGFFTSCPRVVLRSDLHLASLVDMIPGDWGLYLLGESEIAVMPSEYCVDENERPSRFYSMLNYLYYRSQLLNFSRHVLG